MKIYDDNLNEINNSDMSKRIDDLSNKIISFINTKTGNKYDDILKDRKISTITQLIDKKYYLYNNGKVIIRNNDSIKGLSGHAISTMYKDKIDYTNAMYFKKDGNLSDHTLTHELIHILSFNTSATIKHYIYDDKLGLTIATYDIDGNLLDSTNAYGLTEGMTEYLASEFLGSQSETYYFQTNVARILAGGKNKELIEAFFTPLDNNFKEFLDDFDKLQTTIDSKTLVNMPSEGIIDNQCAILEGCIEYSLNIARANGNYKEEDKRIGYIVSKMARNNDNMIPLIALENAEEKRKVKKLSRH